MLCPYCNAQVNAFSEPWQQQRQSKEKICPACKKGVEVVFSAKRYIPMLIGLLFVGWAVIEFMGLQQRHLWYVIVLSPGIALLPSTCLRKRKLT
jgi:hypothetical protein